MWRGVGIEGELLPIPNATLSSPGWFLYQDGQHREPFSCFIDCEGQSHKTVHIPQCFEEKGEPKRT